MNHQYRIISIPIHPDEAHIPHSLINLPLPSGKIVTLSGPLGPKTLSMMHDTLIICRDALVARPEDFEI